MAASRLPVRLPQIRVSAQRLPVDNNLKGCPLPGGGDDRPNGRLGRGADSLHVGSHPFHSREPRCRGSAAPALAATAPPAATSVPVPCSTSRPLDQTASARKDWRGYTARSRAVIDLDRVRRIDSRSVRQFRLRQGILGGISVCRYAVRWRNTRPYPDRQAADDELRRGELAPSRHRQAP